MIAAITSAMTEIISWFGQVVTALAGADGALKELLPLFALGIGISVFMVAIKAIRSVTWGA